MKDRTKICWNCGSYKMTSVETWYKCDDCGATTDNVHQPGSSPVTFDPGFAGKGDGPGMVIHNRPSGVLMSRATKARKKAQERAADHAGTSR